MANVYPKDYKPEESKGKGSGEQKSLFTKLQVGDNKVRITSEAIIGYVWWKDKKAYRCKRIDQIPDGIEKGGRDGWKEFNAFKIWNYIEQTVQILEISQATIKTALFSYNLNDDWGDIREYDINIRRTGEGKSTEYTVIPSPKKEIAPKVLEQLERVKINWDNYISGEKCFEFPNSDKEEIDTKDIPF